MLQVRIGVIHIFYFKYIIKWKKIEKGIQKNEKNFFYKLQLRVLIDNEIVK